MSYIGSYAIKVFGGPANDAGKPFPHQSPAAQLQGETLAVATTSRKIKGPQVNGHYSFFYRITEASAGASAMTVWYSNLPEPDETIDSHWDQDLTIGSIALTAIASGFKTIGNVFPEWIRFKCVVAGDTADLVLWAKTEKNKSA